MLTDANEVSRLVSFDLVEWISLPSGVPERIREKQAIQSTERNKLLEMESVKNV